MEKTPRRACPSPAINTCSAWLLLETRTYLLFLVLTPAQLCKDMAERTNTFKRSLASMTKSPHFPRASPINMHCPGIQFGLGDPFCPQKSYLLDDKFYGPLINSHGPTVSFFPYLKTLRGGSGNTNDRQNCARNKDRVTGDLVTFSIAP